MSITAANAILYLSVTSVFPTPQQIQGFAVDDVYDVESLDTAETMMGVDGNLTGGFVNVTVKQGYSLMADSKSVGVFDAWYAAEVATQEKFTANGSVTLMALGKRWTMTKGFLRGYKPIPDAKKTLQPVKFMIEWQNISKAAA